jgi:hypothetical protein
VFQTGCRDALFVAALPYAWTVQNSTQGESTWPTYVGKACIQRLEGAVSVFSYIEARAYANQEQVARAFHYYLHFFVFDHSIY